ncbi:Flp1 family type IVb pilin [Paenibacillus sp. FA6]|uniref:Flp1 family type IVb pilin n=1 Tax=Paenibacillus sp. FA6 TaxID=3413029 RepID=UPI003F65F3E0
MLMNIWGKVKGFWQEDEGLGMLEMILIIAAIVVIAVVFRDQLKLIVENLLKKVGTKSENFIDGK